MSKLLRQIRVLPLLFLLPDGPLRPVTARFNDETITVQNWPSKDHHIVIGEFHY